MDALGAVLSTGGQYRLDGSTEVDKLRVIHNQRNPHGGQVVFQALAVAIMP